MTLTEKRKPGRPRIPRERIVDAALQIVDEQGADALTLRAVAERISSSTATLYRHVSGRSELIGLVIDRMLGEVELPAVEDDDEQPWEVVCHRTATAIFTTIAQHRSVATLLIERFPTGPHAIALRERIARALLRGGLPPEVAAAAVATLGRYILGFAMQSAADDGAQRPSFTVDPMAYPHLVELAPLLPKPLAEEFEFGLTHLLSGLAHDQRA
ncbi:TetR/AcrR family transcriptional regulator [Agromyces sp. SYSU T00266]|uniref:TetR/AcrR family transcriptional regulator n=1 Tax=Agromyces zhanjiangensis TaxID=3158562 RepID=UPI0033994394